MEDLVHDKNVYGNIRLDPPIDWEKITITYLRQLLKFIWTTITYSN